MTNKNKTRKKSIVTITILSILLIGLITILTTNISFLFKKSVHSNAKRYSTKNCLVFYPKSDVGKDYAKQVASSGKKDGIYDYSIVPYGDYLLIDYGNGISYFLDKQYQSIKLETINDDGKKIVSDYLRYWVKRELPEVYYSLDFLNDSYIENLSFDNVTYEFVGQYLKCRFAQYDVDVLVPLKYIQEYIDMNFGYKDCLYVKPTYIDDKHPVISLTFDDGPQFWYELEESSSVDIVNTLYQYDACATFYCIGDCLKERDAWTDYQVLSFISKSINQGNEYGSHGDNHYDVLTNLNTKEEIVNMINGPAEFFLENFNYQISTYRPPEGALNNDVLNAQPYGAILWSIDSCDWLLQDENEIYDEVMNCSIDQGDIIIFHDIYDCSANAIKKIVPELISRGYQLVSVSDMLTYLGIDVSTLKYYYNYMPSPYYE